LDKAVWELHISGEDLGTPGSANDSVCDITGKDPYCPEGKNEGECLMSDELGGEKSGDEGEEGSQGKTAAGHDKNNADIKDVLCVD